jgi:hypothetical protein
MTKDFLVSIVINTNMAPNAKWVHHIGFDNPDSKKTFGHE